MTTLKTAYTKRIPICESKSSINVKTVLNDIVMLHKFCGKLFGDNLHKKLVRLDKKLF